MKFKIGDRVKLKEGYKECEICHVTSEFKERTKVGDEGIICKICRDRYGVNFSPDAGGHSCDGSCPSPCGQYLCPEHLELVRGLEEPISFMASATTYIQPATYIQPVIHFQPITDTQISNQPKHKSMLQTLTNTLKKHLPGDIQKQYRANLRDGNLDLTGAGNHELLELLAEIYKKELTDRAVEIIKEDLKKE